MELFRFDPPELTPAEVARTVDEHYGLAGTLRRLRGERSHNTHLVTESGEQYVLRVASASEPDAAIECHAAALVHIAGADPTLPVARVIPARSGRLMPAIERDGRRHLVRLETFLPGITFDDDQLLGTHALAAIGALLGGVAAALGSFTHPAARGFMPWDVANGLVFDGALRGALPSDAATLVERAQPRLERAAAAMSVLPHQIVHNDGHAGNLLREGPDSQQVTGVIDFGDLVDTARVADLGVVGASLAPHQADPIQALASIVAGYDARCRLDPAECGAVPDVVLTRLALSTLLVHFQIEHAPHIAADVAAERDHTVANLARWLAVDPIEAARAIEHRVTERRTAITPDQPAPLATPPHHPTREPR